jgi:hypothetical protein
MHQSFRETGRRKNPPPSPNANVQSYSEVTCIQVTSDFSRFTSVEVPRELHNPRVYVLIAAVELTESDGK